ncbi:MAG: hypothetical protein ACJAU0_001956 [Flavobacteriales bacterium]|jgi:hypothetical protein
MKKTPTNINEFTVKQFIESLRPKDEEIRAEIDLGYSYDGAVFILYEIRPIWNDSSKLQHLEFAKIRFYKSRQEWALYWMRASGKWELYEPFPKSTHLDEIIEVIKKDQYGCFFG